MKIISIIVTAWAMNQERSDLLRKSLSSLFETIKNLPVETIIIDNGGNLDDSKYLLELTEQGKINTYIRNHLNMHFGYARNQALNICNGDYIAIVDSDIEYKKGWLDMCLAVLDTYPDEKIYATPIYNVAHWLPKFWSDKVLKVGDEYWRLNRRAGSNCFVVRRRDFEEIGDFLYHRVAGTKWTEEAYEKGYWAAVSPRILTEDMGFRKGYAWHVAVPIKEVLSNGKEVYLNQDEYKRNNSGLRYTSKRKFNPQPARRFKD